MSESKAAAAGAAADFKGWFVVVWLTPGRVSWPRRCACCRHIAETTANAEDGDRLMASYPICSRCQRHAKIDDKAFGVSMLLGALVVVGGWIAAFGLSVMVHIGLQLVLMLLAFVVVTGLVYWLLNRVVGAKLMRCPDDGWPVEVYQPAGFRDVLGKDAERTDEKDLRLWCEKTAEQLGPGAYALQLRSHAYAREFIEANGGDPRRTRTIQEAY